ncbi:MAG: hypothetical protein Q9167_004976 [Letrouitia subvulpina]
MAFPPQMFASRHKMVSGPPLDSQQIASPHQKYEPLSRGGRSSQANLSAGINTHPPHTLSHEAILQQSSNANYGGPPPIRPGVAVVIPVSNKQYYQEPRPTPKAATNLQTPFLSADFKPPVSTPAHDASLIPPIDYQVLLISLADEYFTAAHARGSVAALAQQEAETHTYYKLVATGLGCLEAVLKHFRLQPLVEVNVRLRYAMILYEETENSIQAEEALSKGVAICEMHRLHDLKYQMQHLLARVLYKRNPRASFKFVDGIIQDLEAYQYIPWVYAFRFLRLSFLLEFSSHQENLIALSHVRFLSSTAEKYGDKAVAAIAMTLESLIHLRESNSAESIEQAQRALAAARSSQFDPLVQNNPQLAVLTSFVDLCCALQTFDPKHAASKMQAMQTSLENHPNASAWANDGSFEIPISHTKASPTTGSDGPLRQGRDGKLVLSFNWLPIEDLHVLGYLLSSIAIAYRNTSDGHRSEQLVREGINFLDSE